MHVGRFELNFTDFKPIAEMARSIEQNLEQSTNYARKFLYQLNECALFVRSGIHHMSARQMDAFNSTKELFGPKMQPAIHKIQRVIG